MAFGTKPADITEIKTKTDNLPALPADETTIKDTTRHLTLWSAPANLTLTTAPTDKTLPSITIAGLPTGAVPTHAKAHVKIGAVRDDSASDNYISGDQTIQAQKAVDGTWTDALTVKDVSLYCTASKPGAGDVFGGDQDIKDEVPGNDAVMEFQWLQALSLGSSLYLYSVQVIVEIDYTVS